MMEEEERTTTTAEREMDEGVKADVVAQMPMTAATIAEENFMMFVLLCVW